MLLNTALRGKKTRNHYLYNNSSAFHQFRWKTSLKTTSKNTLQTTTKKSSRSSVNIQIHKFFLTNSFWLRSSSSPKAQHQELRFPRSAAHRARATRRAGCLGGLDGFFGRFHRSLVLWMAFFVWFLDLTQVPVWGWEDHPVLGGYWEKRSVGGQTPTVTYLAGCRCAGPAGFLGSQAKISH